MSSKPLLPNDYPWAISNSAQYHLQVHKSKTASDFMSSLEEDKQKALVKIEKDMHYLHSTFESCGVLNELQDSFLHVIDENLEEAEKNCKSLVDELKKSSSRVSCQQKVLNSVIIALSITVLFLFVIAFIKS